MISSLISKLKKIPIDLGQESVADRTEGKQIALRHVLPVQGKTALDVGARMGEQTRLLGQRGYTGTSVDIELQFDKRTIRNGLDWLTPTFVIIINQ